MGQTITMRLTKELAAWLEEISAQSGRPQGQLICDDLNRARTSADGTRTDHLDLPAGRVEAWRKYLQKDCPRSIRSRIFLRVCKEKGRTESFFEMAALKPLAGERQGTP